MASNRTKTTEVSTEQSRARKIAHARSTTPSRQPQLSLQGTMGNKAVARLLKADGTLVREVRHRIRGLADGPKTIVVKGLLGSGSTVPYKEEMEQSFHRDFSDVRAHTGPAARRAAATLGARAFTLGREIAFGSSSPQRITVAHELAHVVQQERSPRAPSVSLTLRDTPVEVEAERTAAEAVSGKQATSISTGLSPSTIAGAWTYFRRGYSWEVSYNPDERILTLRSIDGPEQPEELSSGERELSYAPDEIAGDLEGLYGLPADSLRPGPRVGDEGVTQFTIHHLEEDRQEAVHRTLLDVEQRGASPWYRAEDVARITVTLQYARDLSDEDLREQVRILSGQVFDYEFAAEPTPEGREDYETTLANLSVLEDEVIRRRAVGRRERVRGTDFGSFERRSSLYPSAEERMLYLMETLVHRYGYSVDGAAGLVGNLWVESWRTLAPNILEGGRLARRGEPAPRQGGVGITQWTGERRQAVLATEMGVEFLFDLEAQVEYMVNELRTWRPLRGEPDLGEFRGINHLLRGTDDLEQATGVIYRNYENPQVVVDWRNALGGDPEAIRRAEARMNGAQRVRSEAARRARAIYLEEYGGR